MDDDELLDRADMAATGISFFNWLRELKHADPEELGPYAGLYFIPYTDGFSPRYEFVKYGEKIEELAAGKADAAAKIAMLLEAEAEWRVDRYAKKFTRKALGMSADARYGVAPLPVRDVECGFKDKGGRECRKEVVPGSVRCEKHGGALIDPNVRQSMLLVAYTQLIEGSSTAVKALIEIAEGGRNEVARVMAAKEILDRSGLSPELRIAVTHEQDEDDRMRMLRAQLNATRERLAGAEALEAEIKSHALPAASAVAGDPVQKVEVISPDGEVTDVTDSISYADRRAANG